MSRRARRFARVSIASLFPGFRHEHRALRPAWRTCSVEDGECERDLRAGSSRREIAQRDRTRASRASVGSPTRRFGRCRCSTRRRRSERAHGHGHAEPSKLRRSQACAHVVAVSSAKGGVGKSTVAANLAVALARAGSDASALLDADVYGPSVPSCSGADARPRLAGEADRAARALRRPADVDGLLPRRRLAGHLARSDGDGHRAAVPARRRLGRAGLPRRRPAARNGRRGADARAAGAAHRRRRSSPRRRTSRSLDVERGIAMFRAAEVPVLGVVENMSELRLPGLRRARKRSSARAAARRSREQFGVPLLASSRSCRTCARRATPAARSSSRRRTTRSAGIRVRWRDRSTG